MSIFSDNKPRDVHNNLLGGEYLSKRASQKLAVFNELSHIRDHFPIILLVAVTTNLYLFLPP